jgi:hypothetical protein
MMGLMPQKYPRAKANVWLFFLTKILAHRIFCFNIVITCII